jgi:hypothetical protein
MCLPISAISTRGSPSTSSATLPATVRNLLIRLATLDDAEITSLAALLPPGDAEALWDAVRVLRQPGATPSMAALSPVLGNWWDTSLRARLSATLREQMFMQASAPPSQ